MVPLEGKGATGVRGVEGGARGGDLRELKNGGDERGEEHVREIHGVGKETGEGRMGRGLRAEERDGGTEMWPSTALWRNKERGDCYGGQRERK